MAKKETITLVLERTYNIPLRREYLKAPNWKRTEKAVVAVREFLQRHMKSETVLLGKSVNEKLWQHGLKNPPHHIKVNATKDDKGVVKAELFGVEAKKEKTEKKERKKAPAKNKEEVSVKKE